MFYILYIYLRLTFRDFPGFILIINPEGLLYMYAVARFGHSGALSERGSDDNKMIIYFIYRWH